MSGKVDKGQISYLLKVRFNSQKKTITKGKIEKSGLAEHVQRDENKHYLL